MSRYTAVVRRSGDWWAIEVPEVPGVHTQVKRLDHAAAMAADALSLMLDEEVTAEDVEIDARLDGPLSDEVLEVAKAREAAETAAARLATAQRDAAVHLVDKGLTYRDSGVLLKVSHQRVQQLVRRG